MLLFAVKKYLQILNHCVLVTNFLQVAALGYITHIAVRRQAENRKLWIITGEEVLLDCAEDDEEPLVLSSTSAGNIYSGRFRGKIKIPSLQAAIHSPPHA